MVFKLLAVLTLQKHKNTKILTCMDLFYSDCVLFVPAFACLGFLSPANRGALMTCAMVLFVCLGTPAGYVSARVYKSFGGEKWKSNVLLTSMLSPGYILIYRLQTL
jgi:hypothetical protein